MEEDGEGDDNPAEEEDIWGGSDEEVCLIPHFPHFIPLTRFLARRRAERTDEKNGVASSLFSQPCST
jgi:hypothetical protein